MPIQIDAPHICPSCGKLWYITGDSYYWEAENNSIVYPLTTEIPICPDCEVPLDPYPADDDLFGDDIDEEDWLA